MPCALLAASSIECTIVPTTDVCAGCLLYLTGRDLSLRIVPLLATVCLDIECLHGRA